MSEIEYVKCPICGKTTPLKRANFKVGDPSQLGLIQVREAMGRAKGFVAIDEYPIIDAINRSEIKEIVEQLVDICSGILIFIDESGLDIQAPILTRIRQLKDRIADLDNELSNKDFVIIDLESENQKLSNSIKELEKTNSNLELVIADLKNDITRLKEKCNRLIDKNNELIEDNEKLTDKVNKLEDALALA
jgi:uncharacterized phage infection (PIP) family protein YhgE